MYLNNNNNNSERKNTGRPIKEINISARFIFKRD